MMRMSVFERILVHVYVQLKQYKNDVNYLSFIKEGQYNVNKFNPKCVAKTQQYNLIMLIYESKHWMSRFFPPSYNYLDQLTCQLNCGFVFVRQHGVDYKLSQQWRQQFVTKLPLMYVPLKFLLVFHKNKLLNKNHFKMYYL